MISSKVKASAWRAISQNSNLSKKIFEAVSSPLGSTKRQQARGTLRSLTRSFGIIPGYDGQGGPGDLPMNTRFNVGTAVPPPQLTVQPPAQQPDLSVTAAQPTRTIFLKPAPTPAASTTAATTAAKSSGLLDKIGGWLQGVGQALSRPGALSLPSPAPMTTTTPAFKPPTPGAGIGEFIGGISALGRALKTPERNLQQEKQNVINALNSPYYRQGPERQRLERRITELDREIQQENIRKLQVGGAYSPAELPKPAAAPPAVTPSTIPSGQQIGAAGEEVEVDVNDYNDLNTAQNTYGPSAVESWYKSLTPDEQKRFKDVYDAVRSGIGPEFFAFTVMADKKKLKQLFPNVPDDQLPVGASLSRQLGDLENSLRKQYQIDEQMNNLISKQNMGLTLQNDLTAYIRGKDEYLGSVDRMIDKTKETMAYSDMSNPYAQERLGNYMNYLTVLKGRQNQRYMDFLDQSINYYNADLQRSQNLLSKSLSEVERRFSQKATIMQEDFNWAKSLLSEMYSTVANQETLAAERAKLQTEKQKAADDHLESVMNVLKIKKELEGKSAKIPTATESSWLEEYALNLKRDEKTKEIMELGNKDIFAIRESAQNHGIDPNIADDMYSKSVAADAQHRVSGSGSFRDVFNDYEPVINRLQQSGESDSALGLQQQIFNSTVDGLRSYMHRDPDGALEVLKKLTGKSGSEPKDKSKFIKDNSDRLPHDLLDELYDWKEINKYNFKPYAKDKGADKLEDMINFDQGAEMAIDETLRGLLSMWQGGNLPF